MDKQARETLERKVDDLIVRAKQGCGTASTREQVMCLVDEYAALVRADADRKAREELTAYHELVDARKAGGHA
jgi:hypothetical protein